MDRTDFGTYVEYEGRPAVRFVRTYPHSIERVWSAVTNSDELRHWFPSRVAIELRPGGTISFSGDPHIEDATGSVLACDPPRQLVFTWGGDELHFELEPLGERQCRFTLINVLHERNAAARNGAGWHICLAELDKRLAGDTSDGPHSASAEPWQPLYERYIAAGLPSGAEIPTSA
jgi:uncharacterized protein YndB with AHSA1/START domain